MAIQIAELPAPVCSAPTPCRWCAGHGVEPDENDARCAECGGSGHAPAVGNLGATRTYKTRPFTYCSGTRRLKVTRGKKEDRYKVRELVVDGGGRGFELVRQDGHRVHHVYIGHGCTCDCEAGTYGTSAKADMRAAESGQADHFPTLGCLHLDALSLLLHSGHLDVPSEPGALSCMAGV